MGTFDTDVAPPDAPAHRGIFVRAGPPVVAVLVVALLAWQVVVGGPVTGLDLDVRNTMSAFMDAHHSLYWPAKIAAGAGTPWLAAAMLGVVAVVLGLERHSAMPVRRAALAVFLLGVLGVSMKELINRPGPLTAGVPPAWGGYFPSGHTASALVCYGAILVLVGIGRRKSVRLALVALLAPIGVWVGAGLLLCEFHWLSDILASVALSFIVLWVTFPPARHRRPPPSHRPANPG